MYGQQIEYLEHHLKSAEKNITLWKLEIEKNEVLTETGNTLLEANRKKLNQIKDEYDVTKPYAMGLLVADIFYSLAAALQGDNY